MTIENMLVEFRDGARCRQTISKTSYMAPCGSCYIMSRTSRCEAVAK